MNNNLYTERLGLSLVYTEYAINIQLFKISIFHEHKCDLEYQHSTFFKTCLIYTIVIS